MSRMISKTIQLSSWQRDIKRIIHGRAEIWNFSSSVQLDISRVSAANQWDIQLNKKTEIPYLQAIMYYFAYYINILSTRRSRPSCHPFMALNRWRLRNLQPGIVELSLKEALQNPTRNSCPWLPYTCPGDMVCECVKWWPHHRAAVSCFHLTYGLCFQQ